MTLLRRRSIFPQRNRIISGLSIAVLIVEAANKSGSIITAKFALEQNRELMAIPGSPLDMRCSGTNNLIKDGAHLVQNSEDILNILENILLLKKSSDQFTLSEMGDKKYNDIYENPSEETLEKYRNDFVSYLSYSPTDIEDIISQSKIPANIVNCLIVELELAGRISRAFGNNIYLIENI